MISDGTYTAVLDRFEADLAVLEVSGDRLYEMNVRKTALPVEGRKQDAVLEVVVTDGDIVEAEYDETETRRRKEDAQSRFDNLSERPPNENDS